MVQLYFNQTSKANLIFILIVVFTLFNESKSLQKVNRAQSMAFSSYSFLDIEINQEFELAHKKKRIKNSVKSYKFRDVSLSATFQSSPSSQPITAATATVQNVVSCTQQLSIQGITGGCNALQQDSRSQMAIITTISKLLNISQSYVTYSGCNITSSSYNRRLILRLQSIATTLVTTKIAIPLSDPLTPKLNISTPTSILNYITNTLSVSSQDYTFSKVLKEQSILQGSSILLSTNLSSVQVTNLQTTTTIIQSPSVQPTYLPSISRSTLSSSKLPTTKITTQPSMQSTNKFTSSVPTSRIPSKTPTLFPTKFSKTEKPTITTTEIPTSTPTISTTINPSIAFKKYEPPTTVNSGSFLQNTHSIGFIVLIISMIVIMSIAAFFCFKYFRTRYGMKKMEKLKLLKIKAKSPFKGDVNKKGLDEENNNNNNNNLSPMSDRDKYDDIQLADIYESRDDREFSVASNIVHGSNHSMFSNHDFAANLEIYRSTDYGGLDLEAQKRDPRQSQSMTSVDQLYHRQQQIIADNISDLNAGIVRIDSSLDEYFSSTDIITHYDLNKSFDLFVEEVETYVPKKVIKEKPLEAKNEISSFFKYFFTKDQSNNNNANVSSTSMSEKLTTINDKINFWQKKIVLANVPVNSNNTTTTNDHEVDNVKLQRHRSSDGFERMSPSHNRNDVLKRSFSVDESNNNNRVNEIRRELSVSIAESDYISSSGDKEKEVGGYSLSISDDSNPLNNKNNNNKSNSIQTIQSAVSNSTMVTSDQDLIKSNNKNKIAKGKQTYAELASTTKELLLQPSVTSEINAQDPNNELASLESKIKLINQTNQKVESKSKFKELLSKKKTNGDSPNLSNNKTTTTAITPQDSRYTSPTLNKSTSSSLQKNNSNNKSPSSLNLKSRNNENLMEKNMKYEELLNKSRATTTTTKTTVSTGSPARLPPSSSQINLNSRKYSSPNNIISTRNINRDKILENKDKYNQLIIKSKDMKDSSYTSPISNSKKQKNNNNNNILTDVDDVNSPELLDIYKSPQSKEEQIEFDNAEYCYQHKIMTDKNINDINESSS